VATPVLSPRSHRLGLSSLVGLINYCDAPSLAQQGLATISTTRTAISQHPKLDENDEHQDRKTQPISLVTLGEGSIHHSHFLSAYHAALISSRYTGLPLSSIIYSTKKYWNTWYFSIAQSDILNLLFQGMSEFIIRTSTSLGIYPSARSD
jgi:hypothetical protein